MSWVVGRLNESPVWHFASVWLCTTDKKKIVLKCDCIISLHVCREQANETTVTVTLYIE